MLNLDINKALTLGGISYILYTDDGKEYVRTNRPCYGELRKYESTHPGDCTQPEVRKPGDLNKNEFPKEGIPSALIIPFSNYQMTNKTEKTDALIEAMYSPDSPWVKGFKEVEFFKNSAGRIHGIILRDLHIDPTVLVNSLKIMQTVFPKVDALTDLVNEGLSYNEAIAATYLNGGMAYSFGAAPSGPYICPKAFSAKRYFGQNPMDLTGGTLADRVDYNRPRMQDPFLGEEKDGAIIWQKAMTAKGVPAFNYGGKNVVSAKTFAEAAKGVFEEALRTEKEPENTPYIWKTTSGRSNAAA